jgi:ketosteroid isomerase-like protein
MDIQHVINQYHAAADEFSRGDALPVKKMLSNRDDVVLANPFGPPVLGQSKVSAALDFASSRFRDGKVLSFETIAKYETPELVTLFEIEKWKAKVSGREQASSFDLRVTSTFRFEDSSWKLVHRHADPITVFHPDGPLRDN